MKYFSMFSGVGGFELGIQKAHPNWECVGFSEIDKYCNIVLEKRFKGVKNYGDATKINTGELPDFDMLCGGFPCQTFSIAGKRRGFKDTRGTMFFEIARILEAKKPKIVVLENVKGLLNHEQGKTFSVILNSLQQLGYDVQWMVLNSRFFGVPQNRERVFIIGNLRGQFRPEILPFRENAKKISGIPTEKEVIGTITQAFGRRGCSKEEMAMTEQIAKCDKGKKIKRFTINNHQSGECFESDGICGTLNSVDWKSPKMIYDRKGFDSRTKGFRENKISPTLSQKMGTGGNNVPMVYNIKLPTNTKKGYDIARPLVDGVRLQYPESKTARGRVVKNAAQALQVGGMGGLNDFGKLRRLTPIECERLQGFPDDFTKVEMSNGKIMSDTQRYKMMGNAVTVNVIEAIFKTYI